MFTAVSTARKRSSADLIVVPFWKGGKEAKEIVSLEKALDAEIKLAIKAGDFTGKLASTMLAYVEEGKEKRLLFLGLGDSDKCTMESLRRSYSAFVKRCYNKQWKTINVVLPKVKGLSPDFVCKAVCEGITLTHYTFESLKSKDNQAFFHINKVNLIGVGVKGNQIGKKVMSLSSGVNLARDLVNGNADDITPQALASTARGIARNFPTVKATIFDRKRIVKEKMGLLLAVSRGSCCDPVFIILEYKGKPTSSETTVVVGKGITFDAGGLNIKPTGSMETMKADMGGGATALGIIQAAAKMKLKMNITAVVPATENGVDARSYKPGDVYVGYSGKTVENGNTDAEGRLVLADALAYSAANLKPKRMIDLATLTGSIAVAIGEERCGLFSNDQALVKAFAKAGEITGEKVWEFPMDPEYKELLKSDIADIKSTGNRMAGSITAATFLREFIGKIPWVHLDVAAVAFLNDPRRYHMTRATGFGVRLVIEMLEQISV